MAVTEEQYRADQEARAALTKKTLEVTEQNQPTPTQEENDLLRLGLMHPDDKASPQNPEMPPVAVQQAALRHAQQTAAVPDRPTPAPGAPSNVDVPNLSGNGAVGETLTCTMGNWHGEPTGYAYDWKSDGTAISGASGNTYVVAAGDAGKSITCVVTATNAAGSTEAPPSNAVQVAGNGGASRMTGGGRAR
jgi:hypothetical protein